MKRKLSTLVVALCISSTVVFGQTIQNSVIASTGASTSSGNVKMDYTVGEVVVETFSAGGNTLTQGFHQTNLTLVAIENAELFSEINLYPNPAHDILNVDIPATYAVLNVNLYDVTGKLLRNNPDATGKLTYDVSNLATGTYYLQIMNPKTQQVKTFKLVKN